MATGDIWITRESGRWIVRREGDARTVATFERQIAAVTTGLDLANQNGKRLVVEGYDGKIPGLTTTATARRRKAAFPK